MEAKEVAERDEERFKFDLSTRLPEVYYATYGDGARDRVENEIEEFVPQNEAEVKEILAAMRDLQESAKG